MGSHDNIRMPAPGHGEAALQSLCSSTFLHPNNSIWSWWSKGVSQGIHTAGSFEQRNGTMKRKHQRGWGRTSGSFLMTLECDGNAVNEEGWDKKLCFPCRDRQAWEEPDEQLGSALLDAFTVEQSYAELCRPQECGMNRVWLRGRQRWHREWAAPLFLLLFPLLPERQWQLSSEDQKGRRWKVNGSGRKRERQETVAPGAPSPVSNSTGTLPTALQFPFPDEK